ncbi:MAG: response regulator [Anaerolineales bacterium]
MVKILYLEDEQDLVDLLPMLLKGKGLEVFATTSIEEALERFTEEKFDAVLLDIMMQPADDMDAEKLDYGRKTGIEVARRMMALKPEIPIVAFTVMTDEKIMDEIRRAKVMHIIHKPSELDQIVVTLAQVTKK